MMSERDRPADEKEIEVTPEMIEAGRDGLWSYNRECDGAGDDALRDIFQAMWNAYSFQSTSNNRNKGIFRGALHENLTHGGGGCESHGSGTTLILVRAAFPLPAPGE